MAKIWKRFGVLIVSIFFVIVIGILAFLSYSSVTKYREELVVRDEQIVALEGSLTKIGTIEDGYVLRDKVRAGTEITEENFEELFEQVDVPSKLCLNTASKKADIVGKFTRVSLVEGTVLTNDDIVEERLDNTVRYFDFILDEMPIGLQAGDYVDIRILMPMNEDFIAISNKPVQEINGYTLKLLLTEGEIHTYNSLMLDKIIYPSSKIYALQYKDAGAQVAAEAYYPINKNIQTMLIDDPNAIDYIKQSMAAERARIDGTLGDASSIEDKELQKRIENLRKTYAKGISDGQKDLEKRIKEAEKAAEKAAKNQAKGGGDKSGVDTSKLVFD